MDSSKVIRSTLDYVICCAHILWLKLHHLTVPTYILSRSFCSYQCNASITSNASITKQKSNAQFTKEEKSKSKILGLWLQLPGIIITPNFYLVA